MTDHEIFTRILYVVVITGFLTIGFIIGYCQRGVDDKKKGK